MKILKKEYDISEETLTLAINLSKSIEELGLSTYTFNSLWRWGIHTVADLQEIIYNGVDCTSVKVEQQYADVYLVEEDHVDSDM